MCMIRHLTLLWLTVAALCVAGIASAWAGGQAPAAGSITICRGLHVVVIAVDANGNETTTLRTCPDVLAKVGSTIGPAPIPQVIEGARAADLVLPSDTVHTVQVILHGHARAPPAPV